MPLLDLTIAIPTRNEEHNLQACLTAIGHDFASEIVILDSGSSDATVQIAQEFGAKVFDFEWNGKYPKKRNWFLKNHRPTTTWVMFIDADEYLTPAFKQEIRNKLPNSDKDGYWLNYKIHFLGKILKRGYGMSKLALFRVGTGLYEYIEEDSWSKLDMEIHEHPMISGAKGVIRSKIDHYDFKGIDHYLNKHAEYASWEAKRVMNLQLHGNSALTRKQQLKYRLMKTPYLGIIYFLGSYVLMGGFLDGKKGLAFAIFKMSYFTQIYSKIVEQSKAQKSIQS